MSRRRILVIADDFTGAAEIAGIGSRFGLTAEIVRESPVNSSAELLVIDTDSRSLEPARAAQRVREILGAVATNEFGIVFKKIDSLLRGPVVAEVEAAMEALGKAAAVVSAANPSRGRTITNGEYRVDGVPLHLTSLAHDPEYPRQSSRVLELIGSLPECVTIEDATSSADVQRWAQQIDDRTLPAGGADFFTAILSNLGFTEHGSTDALGTGRILMVCGSATKSSVDAIYVAMQRGVQAFQILDEPDDGDRAIRTALNERSSAIVTGGPMGQATPEKVLQKIADTVGRVLDATTVDELLIEGGATSAAILERMGWQRFTDCIELAPGVVRMAVHGYGAHLTVKPGSYPWPESIWKQMFTGMPNGAT